MVNAGSEEILLEPVNVSGLQVCGEIMGPRHGRSKSGHIINELPYMLQGSLRRAEK
jgi:hypothetical protein